MDTQWYTYGGARQFTCMCKDMLSHLQKLNFIPVKIQYNFIDLSNFSQKIT